MCLITEQKKAIRTTEDMIVWKVMEGNRSTCKGFGYEVNKLYKTRMKQDYSFVKYGDSMVRSSYKEIFRLVNDHDGDVSTWKKSGFIAIGSGFHSCATKARAEIMRVFSNYDLRSFLIPAGSLIYKDRTGLIVSNQIMMLPEENL